MGTRAEPIHARQYREVLPEIRRLDSTEVLRPRISTATIITEALNLQACARRDKEQLQSAAIDWELVESLERRAGALRFAQQEWDHVRFEKRRAREEWEKILPSGVKLERELMRVFRFACHDDSKLLMTIKDLTRGRSAAQIIQRLLTCATFGRANRQRLTAVGFDMRRLDEAEELSREMADARARAVAGKRSEQACDMRDRAYTYLLLAMREVRRVGKFVFAGDRAKAADYASEYYRSVGKTQDEPRPA